MLRTLGACLWMTLLFAAVPSVGSPAGGEAPHVVEGSGYTLRFVGTQRATVMMGSRASRLDLRRLAGKRSLMGLGPVEGLTGEMTIIDGRPALSRVDPAGAVQVAQSFETGAPFFVWAEVAGWRAQAVPASVRSAADLERFVGEAGAAAGLARAFPFKVTGTPARVAYHVLDARPDRRPPPGMAAHKAIQKHFAIEREPVTLAGFHSREHGGVFTHMGSSVHMHVVDAGNSRAGHVEQVEVGDGRLTLWLPWRPE